MIKVLFVCLGNICRSPLAEGIFKNQVKMAGLERTIMVDSAGTSGWHIGDSPDPRSIEIARRNGIILDSYGRKAVAEDFLEFDYILAMDQDNYTDLDRLRRQIGNGKAQLSLMRDFDHINSGADVPDPYYGGPDGFRKVFDMLERSCKNLLEDIIVTNKLS